MYFTWPVCLLSIFIAIIGLWILFGRKQQQKFIGLNPLNPNVNSRDYFPIDNTPNIPNLLFENFSKNSTSENSHLSESTINMSCEDSSLHSHYSQINHFLSPTQFLSSSRSSSHPTSRHPTHPSSRFPCPLKGPIVEKQEENGKQSTGERICCEVMTDIFKQPFTRVRPDFLKNPETGHNLEIDCYNDKLKIGVEYNGIQHYVWPNFTNMTKEAFLQQVRRDQYKVETCDKNGIYLITVPYNVPHNMIRDYIIHYLPDNVGMRST